MLIAQPATLGPYTLKNRIVMAPMGTNFSSTDGISTDRDRRYYEERAIGGVAMIMTEAMPTSEGVRNHHNSMNVYHDRYIPGLALLVESVQKHDCRIFGQLSHRGGLLRRSVLGMEPVGPSPWVNPGTGEPVRALKVDEIKDIQLKFAQAARRLKQAGYDGVEIHAANGYLFHEFFTERVNKRTDAYGGSVENRMRLLLETVARIQDLCGDFPVLARISVTEYCEGGYGTDEVIALAQALERAGVIALDLSGGSNESPALSRFCIQPPSMPRKCLEPYARPIKQAVNIPVMVAGRILTPLDAESILEAGSSDFISLGRALYADAHWCKKAFGEIKAPIRECISCNVCFERLTLEQDVCCVQNPAVGTEFESIALAEPQLSNEKTATLATRRRVLVIGAGVAGAEAARVAAGLGHQVEIWESTNRLGGQIYLAVAAPDKEEVWPAWTYRWQEIEALKVPVKLNVTVTEENLRAYAPDLVIVATGSRPRPSPVDFSGLDAGVRQLHAWDLLANPDLIQKGAPFTVIGGGMVGIEVADLFATRGSAATLIEITGTVAPEMARNNRIDILLRLKQAGVRTLLNTSVQSARGRSLQLKSADGVTEIDAGAAVVTAIGPRAERSVVPVVERAGCDYVLVGDCNAPGDFMSAIRDGYFAAMSLRTRFV